MLCVGLDDGFGFEGVKKDRFERKVRLFGLKEKKWKVKRKFMKICDRCN